MAIYCGARRAASERAITEYARRGWSWEAKEDGLYVELTVGVRPGSADAQRRADGGFDRRCRGATARPGVIVQARYRSGDVVTLRDVAGARGAHRCSDLVGLETPWAPGTVLIGELMVQTPRARAWQDAHHRIRGVVLFDVLAEGRDDVPGAELQDLAARGIVPAEDWGRRPNAERRAKLEQMVGQLEGRAARALSLVRRGPATGARRAYREIVEAGGEGIVLVDPGAAAGDGKRKVKRVDALDCRVVAVLPDERAALVALGSRPPFRVSLPAEPIRVGQVVEVEYRGWYDESLTPRHAVIGRVREDLR